MRTVLAIGIGAGDPDHLTLQAVNALNRVDVFFVVDKGPEKADLVRLRQAILDRFVQNRSYKLVSVPDPRRDRSSAAYEHAVDDWRHSRADVYETLIRDHLKDSQCGGILVWGDPALYDSTLVVLDEVKQRGNTAFEYSVIPGISSVSALAAAHRIALNRVGRPVLVTTGRRLAAGGLPSDVDDVVVMLDAHCSFNGIAAGDIEIFWGAYLGTADEIVVSGPLAEVADRITELRAEATQRKGWIMDTYLLRRMVPAASPGEASS